MIRTLQNYEELGVCRGKLAAEGIDYTKPGKLFFWTSLYNMRFRFRSKPPLPDFVKSWDVFHAQNIIKQNLKDKQSPILDMGCFNSEILLALDGLGYRNLHGCDLNPHCRWMPYWHRIHYGCENLMKTSYNDNFFSAITCISVIEHGVDIEQFAVECHRLLKPGGLLILTTDFDSLNPHNISEEQRMFNQPWRIFDKQSLQALIENFAEKNFQLLDSSQMDLSHKKTPISWNGEDYTFAMLVLKKNESI